MKEYEVIVEEIEVWERRYIVFAEDETEAKDKVKSGDWEECPFGECDDALLIIRDVTDLNEVEE